MIVPAIVRGKMPGTFSHYRGTPTESAGLCKRWITVVTLPMPIWLELEVYLVLLLLLYNLTDSSEVFFTQKP